MIAFRIKIKDSLLGDFYPAKGAEKKGVIIFLSGMPGYLHKNIFGEQLSLRGYDVVQPFYYGSWVSGGDFSVENCQKTLLDTIEQIKKGVVWDLYSQKQLPIFSKNIYLGGMSFGSVIVQTMNIPRTVKKTFLISSVPIFKEEYNSIWEFGGDDFISFINRGFPYVYRIADQNLLAAEFAGQGNVLNKLAADLSGAVFFQGNKDRVTPGILQSYLLNEGIEARIIEVTDAGHALNEYDQLMLAGMVDNFLQE